MNKLDKLEESLDKLHNDFNTQVDSLINEPKEFHKALISLSSKYPEHEELLQFIVVLNDNIETNHNIFSDVIVSSFNELIKIKKELIDEIRLFKDTEQINNNKYKFNLDSVTSFVKDMKGLLISISIIFILLIGVLKPEILESITTYVVKVVQ